MSRPLVRDGGQRTREYPQGRVSRTATPAERIHRYVVIDDNGCWIWQATIAQGSGYGLLTIDGKVHRAHRVSYETFVGPISEGLHVDHLCRVRECCNPAHLEPVTPAENNRRSPLTHGKETHCPQGHPYDEANTYAHKGHRHCRACQRARARAYTPEPSTPEQREERRAYRRAYRSMTRDQRAARKAAGLPIVDSSKLGRAAA